jgi:hypothetical protein
MISDPRYSGTDSSENTLRIESTDGGEKVNSVTEYVSTDDIRLVFPPLIILDRPIG